MPSSEDLTVEQDGGRLELPAGGVALRGARLVEVDLSGQNVAVLRSFGSRFEGCDLSGVSVGAGSMSASPDRTVWKACRFRGTDLRGVLPGTARFEGCAFEDARLDGWICRNADFVDCTFAGTLREVVFSGRTIPTTVSAGAAGVNEIRGNDFHAAVLHGVEFVRGVDLSAQRLPEGADYVRIPDAPRAVRRAQLAVASWEDEPARQAAERMLKAFTVRGYEDQPEIFTRRDRSAAVPEAVRDRVWSLLLGEG